MPAKLTCPKCSAVCQVPDDAMGKTIRCARCEHAFAARAESAIAAGKPGDMRRALDDDKPTPRRAAPRKSGGGALIVVGVVVVLLLFSCLLGGVALFGGVGWLMFSAAPVAPPVAKVAPAPIAVPPDFGKPKGIGEGPPKNDDPIPPPPVVGPPNLPPDFPIVKDAVKPPVEKKPGAAQTFNVTFGPDGRYTANNELTDIDARDAGVNNPYKRYAVTFQAGQTYVIDHMSTEFDAFLRLLDDQGKELAHDDDGGEGLNSRIRYQATRTGRYYVHASQLFARPGRYTLTIRREGAGDAVAEKKLDLPKIASTAPNTPLPTSTQALVGGARATFVTPKADADFVDDAIWHDGGKTLFLLDANGLLRRIRADGWVEERRVELGRRAANLALSGAGLVVALPDAQEIWVIDPNTFAVTGRHDAPGVRRVVAAPATKQAVAVAGANDPFGGNGLRLIDLEGRQPAQTVKLPGQHLVMSPDGKSLFAQGGIEQLFRYRIDGNNIVKEDETPRIAQNGQRINISPDGKLVCLPSGGGNYQDQPDHPKISTYTTYVYATDNLRRPAFTIPSAAYPRVVGFDPVGGNVFAQNHDTPLLVFSMTGLKQKEFKFTQAPGARAEPLQFAAHPKGNKVLVRFSRHVTLVDLTPEGAAAPDQPGVPAPPGPAKVTTLKDAEKSLQEAEGKQVVSLPVFILEVHPILDPNDRKRDLFVFTLRTDDNALYGPDADASGKLLTQGRLNFVMTPQLYAKYNAYKARTKRPLAGARLTFTIERLAGRHWLARVNRIEITGKGKAPIETIE